MNTVYVDDGRRKFITLSEHLSGHAQKYVLTSWIETGIVFYNTYTGKWGSYGEADVYGHPVATFVPPPAEGQRVIWMEVEEAEAWVDVEYGLVS